MKHHLRINPWRNRRGSALIVAMIAGAIIAVSIASYIQLAVTTARLADRSFYSNGAQNLLDTGLEQVLWALNNEDWSTAGFAPRSGFSGQYQATFPSSSSTYTFSQGVTGSIKVWADASSSSPHAVAKATVTLGDGTKLEKVAEAYLKRRSFFNNGMVAHDTIHFVGNVTVDSWNSDPDNDPSTPAISYSTAVDEDGGRIASLSIEVDSISVGNADVYGYAAIGSSDLSGIDVGASGRLGPYGTASGDIDVSRVTYDFVTNFPDVSSPTTSDVSQSYTLSAVTTNLSLPRTAFGDLPASDGKYYYFVPSITLSGSEQLTIVAGDDVVVVLTDTTGNVVQSTGNAGINIPATSSLTFYASANISIGGNGVLNGTSGTPSQPDNFQIYGTRSASEAAVSGMQSFDISGNGYLSSVIYGPNANVAVNGNGDTYGAIVSNEVDMNGNGAFHFDESLSDLNTVNLWGLAKWRELTLASERTSYSTELSF